MERIVLRVHRSPWLFMSSSFGGLVKVFILVVPQVFRLPPRPHPETRIARLVFEDGSSCSCDADCNRDHSCCIDWPSACHPDDL